MSLVVVQGPHLRPGGNSELPEVKHAFEEGTPTAAYYAEGFHLVQERPSPEDGHHKLLHRHRCPPGC